MSASNPRHMTIETPLSTEFVVRRIDAEEHVSDLFKLQLLLSTPRTREPIAIHELLGQRVTVHFHGVAGARHFNGIVREVVELEQGRDAEALEFQVDVVPALWLSTRRVRSRIFQRQSVPDIVKAVLAGLRPDVEFRLLGTYPARDYCVQYRESDFQFVSRLLEDEGISYFFRHELVPRQPGDNSKNQYRHVLVITDDTNSFLELPGQADLTFDPSKSAGPDVERVLTWRTAQQVIRQVFTLRDQHFELSDSDHKKSLRVLETSHQADGTALLGRVQKPLRSKPLRPDAEPLELFEHNTGFARHFQTEGAGNLTAIFDEQKRIAKVREEEEVASAVRADASANYMHLAPGHKARVTRLGDKDGTYLLTSVTQRATQSGARSAEDFNVTHECQFTCVPQGLPVRPARKTPRPRIEGSQTAIVTGTPGKPIDVDKYGRVKVQFHWDRLDQYNQNSSCWVRVSQLWAGDRWGAFFWPRPGMEVIVTFEDGDPDRPLITGCVYNAANMPPPALPGESMTAGIKSRSLSTSSSAPYCSIIFYDDPDNEHVLIHSPNDDAQITKGMSYRYGHGPNIEVLGHMPFSVSGSGSGGGLFDTIIGYEAGGAAGAAKDGPEAALKGMLDSLMPAPGAYKYGFNGMLGVNFLGNAVSHNILGGKFDYCIAPQGLLQLHNVPMASWRSALLGLPAAAVEILVSAKISQLYESDKVEFIRGGNVVTYIGGPLSSADHYQQAWATGLKVTLALLGVSMATFDAFTIFLGTKYPGLKMDSDPKALANALMIAGIANAIIERLHALSLALETAYCRLGSAKEAVESSLNETRATANIATYNPLHMLEFQQRIEQLKDLALDSVARGVTNTASAAAAARTDTTAPITEKTKFSGVEQKAHKASYYLSATGHLSLTAKGKDPAESLGAIRLAARGADVAKQDGLIAMSADGAIDLDCNGARIGVAKSGLAGTSYMSVPIAGAIKLMASTAIQFPNTVTVDKQGITLECGAPGLGSKVTMTPTEVKIQVGTPPAAGSEVTLTPTGIKQACGIAQIETKMAEIGLNIATTNAKLAGEVLELSSLTQKITASLQAEIDALKSKVAGKVTAEVKGAISTASA